jgi:hypothetical protein
LHADKRATWRAQLVGQAQRNRFLHSFHEHVQRLGLRVTAAQFRNVGDESAFFILLDDDGERNGTLGHGSNYTPATAPTVADGVGWNRLASRSKIKT